MTKWKLVPVEPDEHQIYAMRSAFYRVRRGGAGGQTLYACYQRENAPELAAYSAMLEAAPQPPKSEPIAYIEHHKGGDNLVWDNPGGEYSALYTAPPAPSVPDGWKNAAEWLRNNYQDYPSISSLCEAMVAQSANNGGS